MPWHIQHPSIVQGLVDSGHLSAREAMGVESEVADYSARLLVTSNRRVWVPLLESVSDEERDEVVAATMRIIRVAVRLSDRLRAKDTNSANAKAQLIEHATRSWLCSMVPLFCEYLDDSQRQHISDSANERLFRKDAA